MVNRERSRTLFGVLLLVFIFFVILMIFATYTMNIFKNESLGLSLKKENKSIAVVEIKGVIADSRKIVELIHKAEEDKETSAILLRIDSPGGVVGPVQEIYEEVLRIDGDYEDSLKKRKKNKPVSKFTKPVYASFGAVAASGGYYIGAATRKIYANAGTLTGSIGVVSQFVDLSELYKFAKIKQEVIKAGRYKDAGSPHRSITEEERSMMERKTRVIHQQFIDDISRVRKEKIKGDLLELAQGQLYSGQEAKKVGLVDELGSMWKAGRDIHKELKLSGKFGFKYIKERKRSKVWDLLEQAEGVMSSLQSLIQLRESRSLFYFK